MTDPDDIGALSRAWRNITDEAELCVSAALRRQRVQALLLFLELAACGVALAAALCFWLAGAGVVYRVAGSLLVAAAVASGLLALRTRAGLGRWVDWTPEGVLAFRLRACQVALMNAKYALGSSAVLLLFAAFVWLAAELEWDVLPPGFHHLYAAVVATTVLAVAVWATWRIPAKRRERARLIALLEEQRDE